MKPVITVNKVNREFLYRTYKCKLCNVSFQHYENYLVHLEVNHESKKKNIYLDVVNLRIS